MAAEKEGTQGRERRRDGRAGARPREEVGVLGGKPSSECSWCNIEVFLTAKLMGDRCMDEHRRKHSECRLCSALFQSQDKSWVHMAELGAITVHQV